MIKQEFGEAFKQPVEALGDNLLINYADRIENSVALLAVKDILIASVGNISVIGGKQKSRKSFFTNMLLTAYLEGEYGVITGNSNEKRPALLFDTEMGKNHVQKSLRRICRMCGLNEQHDRLKVFFLRECSIQERIEIVKTQVEKYKPGFVVIDGAVDLCANFNDIDASTNVVQCLMELSSKYNCHITTILHENKGLADSNLRGHLGTILSQKCESVIQLQKDGENTRASAVATRNIPFDDFLFKINDEGLPTILELVSVPPKPTAEDKMIKVMRLVLDEKALNYGILQKEYEEAAGVKERTAQSHIAKCLQLKIIYKSDTDDKYRCTKYR
ncbi:MULTISPECIES: AAA family ATPase [Parabacteroides]|uniref:AAA family ATPase n=1 Tax=Parabacteroides faecis TaxID=1217282 RepID=A0ABR6KRL8_9BACT|nr:MULTISPECIES: AAA family ATPase [Parabacteroides]MBB4624150.1 hypothetical protein [Parabacteroides faecis]MBC8620676.1 AAA family ATPase [Parabacteroides faecis]RHR93413.1 hypothetical protein DWW23_21585 [Parabacteroides sp. AF14-59]GGK11602.1 hypothetical protein GCM10007084_38670 [Parabacteroides faecis]